MNNKRGGIGVKILLVLVLMLLSAGGGAYGYRVMDGKLAVREAQKMVKGVEVSDYDTEEAAKVQVYVEKITKDLETVRTRKEAYEIMDEFKDDISEIQTKAEKELEAAKREAEQARNANNNGSNTGNSNNSDANAGDGSDNGYKSNNLSNAEDGSENSGGLLNNLFGSGNDN
ncbi:MAG: hypothetical protein IKE52_04895 [Mogibacterium sp.]|nr:hypothetical protein [Mogibacterium sp.]